MNMVYRHENPSAVYSARNILQMNGIDCLLKNEQSASMGAEFGISNLLELWVQSADDALTAKELIDKNIASRDDREEWVCNDCQERNEGNFEICWKCQAERSAVSLENCSE